MRIKNSTATYIAGVTVATLSITALHLATPLDRIVLHQVYQRLYYIPIIAAAVKFGLRGGLLAALFASVAYIPHVLIHWQHSNPDYALNQYAEIVLFNVVGIVTGALGDRSRTARARAEQTAAELQRAYAELRRTFEQLLRADRLISLGELSAAIVHEVRNPLGAIKGAVEIMEDGIPADSPRREFATIAKREIDRLDRLVEEFLRFARSPKPTVERMDLNELIETVASLIERQAATQGVEVTKELASPRATVLADAAQIRQALLNLCLNSLQAMPTGGRLTIRTRPDGEKGIAIEIEDEGGGIDPKIGARIFDPFFTTKERGLGLGLSIACKIAIEHGGTLNFRNGEKGAVFRLTLPASA
ncbi:MAG: sensor histidine kinase [Pyrinomonas sp.]|uniref:sensor histidine kinase n=1 Tax=Pyrinomonas sp. TaxID=2080306 RepID=UPI00332A6269